MGKNILKNKRKKWSKDRKGKQKGKDHPRYGSITPEETKRKISEGTKKAWQRRKEKLRNEI